VNPPNFFAELKRRNVNKIAVAYVVVGWLLIPAASIFLPAFDAPPWVIKVVLIFLVLGFPIALVFSSAFEVAPEGIKLESEVEPDKSNARHRRLPPGQLLTNRLRFCVSTMLVAIP
jgi:hypothetical protein